MPDFFKNTSNLTDLLCKFSEGQCSNAELQKLSEIQDKQPAVRKKAMAGLRIHRMLKSIPQVPVSQNFDTRMAARFAMELEKETVAANRKHLDVLTQLQAD